MLQRSGSAVFSQAWADELRPGAFVGLLVVEVFGLYLLRLPLLYNFNNFAFWDSGSFLVAHYLLQQGHQPFSYFGWQYGLLPLFIQELGFHLFGSSPVSFLCLSVPCFATVAVVTGRIAQLEGGSSGQLLVILSLPLLLSFQPDLPHALEAALLSLGLLSQLKGRRGSALALAAAASFTKPSMGYLYGLVLLLLILLEPHRAAAARETALQTDLNPVQPPLPHRWRGLQVNARVQALIPATCTAVGLMVVLSLRFGWQSALLSLLPLSGARAYRALHLGWSGVGKELLYFPGVKLGYYIGTPAVFWIVATAYLALAAVAACVGAPGKGRHMKREMVLTCAGLHLGFIALFYGHPASWTYYAYVLVIGVIATKEWAVSGPIIGLLCVLAAAANYSGIRSAWSAWRTTEPNAATAGLFAAPAERGEWSQVVLRAKPHHAALLTNLGGGQLLFPWLCPPAGAFMIAGVATPGEIFREQQELRSANTVIIPTIPGLANPLSEWPAAQFKQVLKDRIATFKGTYFQVYQRRIL